MEGERHIDQAEEVGEDLGEPGRPHRHDLRVAPDDQGVGVVPGMAPAPDGGLAHDHERRDVVDDIVHPAGPKRGAVPALVPARIRSRAVQDAVAEEERRSYPAAPEPGAETAAQRHDAKPDRGVPERRLVAPPHQLLHPLARNRRRVPLCRGEPALLGEPAVGPGQAVVSAHGHRRTPGRAPSAALGRAPIVSLKRLGAVDSRSASRSTARGTWPSDPAPVARAAAFFNDWLRKRRGLDRQARHQSACSAFARYGGRQALTCPAADRLPAPGC